MANIAKSFTTNNFIQDPATGKYVYSDEAFDGKIVLVTDT